MYAERTTGPCTRAPDRSIVSPGGARPHPVRAAGAAAADRRGAARRPALGLATDDVDSFKPYNDHYGHPAGDECLRRVAKSLRAALRDHSDIVCRCGGEEFAVILPGADEAGCLLAAERIRATVHDLDLPHRASPLGRVTISVGVTSYRPQLDELHSPDELIAVADRGLYAAKRAGRNRVCPAQGVLSRAPCRRPSWPSSPDQRPAAGPRGSQARCT